MPRSDCRTGESQATGTRKRINPHRTEAVPRIHVAKTKVRRGERMRRVLIDGDGGIGTGRDFIDICQINRKDLVSSQATGIGGAYSDIMARGTLVVE